MSEVERIKPYIPILEVRRFEIYPAPKGLEQNEFDYVDFNGTHLKIRNALTGTEYYVPLEMIEFANPGKTLGILRLKREMTVRGTSFV